MFTDILKLINIYQNAFYKKKNWVMKYIALMYEGKLASSINMVLTCLIGKKCCGKMVHLNIKIYKFQASYGCFIKQRQIQVHAK